MDWLARFYLMWKRLRSSFFKQNRCCVACVSQTSVLYASKSFPGWGHRELMHNNELGLQGKLKLKISAFPLKTCHLVQWFSYGDCPRRLNIFTGSIYVVYVPITSEWHFIASSHKYFRPENFLLECVNVAKVYAEGIFFRKGFSCFIRTGFRPLENRRVIYFP